MNYPFWETGSAYGIMMAIIAVLHVFISHFAIGGGLYLVVAEIFARRHHDMQRLNFLKGLSKFFLLVTLVGGASTGVGIWFIIGLLNPAATEVLIHNFVWLWATEWTFFLIEICAAIIYYYGWQKMSAKNHLIVGWIYFAAAWMSLFFINGIVSFMLTPGEWLTSGDVWDGFFNPTFWPSLALRTGICIMLAGLFSLLVISRYKPSEFKTKTSRYQAAWGLVGIIFIIPGLVWFLAAIPETVSTAAQTWSIPGFSLWLSLIHI